MLKEKQHSDILWRYWPSSPAGMRVLLIDQWIETGGTMKAAIQLVEKQGATVAGQARWRRSSLAAPWRLGVNVTFFGAGVAAVAIEDSEGGKWIKEHYKASHCIPEELQGQLDRRNLDFFNGPKNWGQDKWCFWRNSLFCIDVIFSFFKKMEDVSKIILFLPV